MCLKLREYNKPYKLSRADFRMGEKEERIKKIVKIYYSNPRVQQALLDFSKDREVVPSYMMGHFGKRPDMLQYPADIMGLVNKGATSFHASEELWKDPLQLSSEISSREMSELRKGWDLLIDVDSKYFDCSKIAAMLLIKALENHKIENYGVKFSGSKGFHIIVGNKAFPEEFNGMLKKEMFPEWPRAICSYLKEYIKKEYNKEVGLLGINFKALEERTSLKKEDVTKIICPECGKEGKKGNLVKFVCPVCKGSVERKNIKLNKRKLRCTNEDCAGILEVTEEKELFYCENCNASSWDKLGESRHKVVQEDVKGKTEEFGEEISGEILGGLDLILVSPRHLFRMPYSLHEKTSLASIVLDKNSIRDFDPRSADALRVEIKNFLPDSKEGEARYLLNVALAWNESRKGKEFEKEKEKYKTYEKVNFEGATEEMFPQAIKKLLKGLQDGRKRGLFILLTFLKTIGFSGDKIFDIIKTWNEKNSPPLREAYVKSQIGWHLKQKKQILPPNYNNDNFYKDLQLLDKPPKTKNPVVDVAREIKKKSNAG